MGQTMTTAIYKETFDGGNVIRQVELKTRDYSVDECRRKMIEKIKAESKCDSDTHKSECKPQPNVTFLREELESAQARVLKLEVWAKSAFWYITTGDRDEGTIALDVDAVLGDIKAIKKLLAGAINDLNRDCEDDSEED